MKSHILLAILLLSFIHPKAQVSDGPRNPSTFSSIGIPGYSQAWTNLGNAAVSDNNYSTFGNLNGGSGSYTNYIVAKGFGFDIPGGTNISGIKVEVECSDPNNRTSDYSVRIVKKGVVTGTNKATGANYPTSDAYMVYGGASDLWGTSWSYKDIDDGQFGVAVSAQRNVEDQIVTAGQINSIRITVYFTYTTLPVSLTSFTATKQSSSVLLNWKTSSESNMDNYVVERSSNGASFSPIATVPSLNSTSANYNYTDNHPLPGISYYRLTMKELTGDQKYSSIVAVSFARNSNTTFLYPSPWEKGTALNISNMNGEKLTIYFMNAGGQVLSTSITDSGIVPTETLMSKTGLIFYKVFDQAKNQIGSGSLLIL